MRRARNKRALPTSAPKTVTFARCTPQPTTTHSTKDAPSTHFVRRTRARTGPLPVPLTHARPASPEAGRAKKPTHFAIACGVGFEVYGFRKAGFENIGMNDISSTFSEKKTAFGSFRSNFFYWPIARSSIVAFDSTRWRLLTLKTD